MVVPRASSDSGDCLDDNLVSEFVSGSLAKSVVTKVEGHLAGCRDCRALVAALAADAADDSNLETRPHEKPSPSQVTHLPRKVLTVGDRVGRYLVLSTLGTGGMGVVFAAYDPQLDRKVALKLLRSGLQLATKDAQKRLRREAQAIAQLSHPNVVGVYDVGTTDDGDLYIAMEFVEGDTLSQWLKKYPRTWHDIIEVFQQAGRGLVAAHGVGLLHRDFKPDNVLVGGDGRVRVTDFGLARSLLVDSESERGGQTPILPTALSSPLTATGTVLGTPRYMPPEQLKGPDIDARADQFSFCVALHEALYGEHPLPGATSVSMLEKGDKAFPPPEGARVPALIARAVARGLESDRTRRFPTMAALMTELVPPSPKVGIRNLALALGGLIVVGGVAGAMIAQREDPPPKPPTDDTTTVLVEKINELNSRITAIDRERRALIEELKKRPATQDDVVKLQQQLEDKDKQIQALVAEVTRITVKEPRAATKRPPSQSFAVINMISDAERDLEGCFEEWGERRDDLGNPHIEANMLVRLVVGADGIGHSSVATGEPSPSLRWCVEQAIARVRFPTGPEQLDLEVNVGWSQGLLNLSPRVVGRREAPRSIPDLR